MTFRNKSIPLLASISLMLTGYMIYRGLRKPPVAPVLFEPARSPYEQYIAGEGLVEALTDNVALSVVFPDLIVQVCHEVGDYVNKGEPLFIVDTRRLQAELKKAQQEEQVALRIYQDKKNQFSYFERLRDTAAVSEQDYCAAQYARSIAHDRLKASQAVVHLIKTDLERSITRAPFDGEVLQINICKGEFGNVNPFDRKPLMLFGETKKLRLRIDIDETESWRFKKGAPAVAFVRGNAHLSVPLTFDHIEPYMVPKETLTGSNAQRVDTRVLQVIYTFERHDMPIFVGQLLDVFLQALPYQEST